MKKLKQSHKNALLVGAGFLAGTVGVKALTSDTAKKAYVNVLAQGMRAKAAYQDVVEQAKANVDDMVAEAAYMTCEQQAKAEGDCACATA